MSNLVKVILDTNFLLIPGQFKVDIFDGIDNELNLNYGLQIVDLTLEELKKLVSRGKGADRAAAKLALKLLEAKDVEVIDTGSYSSDNVDDLIVEIVREKGCFVATQDKELKRRVVDAKGQILTLRQKKYIRII